MKADPHAGTGGPATQPEKPTHDQIAALAYQLYLDRGRQEGHDVEDWRRAEELLLKAGRPNLQRTEWEQPAEIPQPEIRPLDTREYPWARDERGSASREEIRRQTTQMRPAARQSRRETR